VLLDKYIEIVKSIRDQELNLQKYVPAKIEVMMNASFIIDGNEVSCIEKKAGLATTGSILCEDILLAGDTCNIKINKEILIVRREDWKFFNVTDAGMNYDQAIQINNEDEITKIHEDSVVRDNCWIHRREIPQAMKIPQAKIRCLGCSLEFNDDNIENLMTGNKSQRNTIKIKKFLMNKEEDRIIKVLESFPITYFVEDSKELWKLVTKCLDSNCIKVVDYCMARVPYPSDAPTFKLLAYQMMKSPLISIIKIKEFLKSTQLAPSKSKYGGILLEDIIKNHAKRPTLLMEKLNFIFENRRQLEVSGDFEMINVCSAYAIASTKFTNNEFIEGFDILFKYGKEMIPGFFPEMILSEYMVLDAAAKGDIRLLIFLTQTHKLKIDYSDSQGQNAFFVTSSPSTIEYLYKRKVDPCQVSHHASTPITRLLERVIRSQTDIDDYTICKCISLLFSYGVQQHVNPLYEYQIGIVFGTFETFYNKPLNLATEIREEYNSHAMMYLLIKTMNEQHVLPTWAEVLFLTKEKK